MYDRAVYIVPEPEIHLLYAQILSEIHLYMSKAQRNRKYTYHNYIIFTSVSRLRASRQHALIPRPSSAPTSRFGRVTPMT